MLGLLFLQYAENSARGVVAAALNRVGNGLICEVLTDHLTAESALKVCERLYSDCYRPFGPKLWVTVSSLGLGHRPDPHTFPGPVFTHDSFSTARAKCCGFRPELISPVKGEASNQRLHLPTLPYEVAGMEGALVGEFETVGVAEMLSFSVAALLAMRKLRVEIGSRRSLRLATEEVLEAAHILAPSVDIEVSRSVLSPGCVQLLNDSSTVVFSLPSSVFPLVSRSEDVYAFLESSWRLTTESLGIEEEVSQYWFERLSRLYSDDRREYHSLRHVSAMLRKKEQWAVQSAPLDLAIWFHDAVYLPKESDNEEQSAVLLATFLQDSNLTSLSYIGDWILATKSHAASSDDPMELLLLDLDLWIFAEEAEEYDRYSRGIFTEYAWVVNFRQKRAQVMRTFLEKDRIFRSRMATDEMEQRARVNITREIAQLEDVHLSPSR